MKLKYIFASIVAALALAVSCTKEADQVLDEIKLSTSYVSIPMAGGSAQVTVTASQAWSFNEIINIGTAKAPVMAALPKWLTASAISGNAGETTITFSADATEAGRNVQLQISCGGKTQFVNLIQGLSTAALATCKEIMEGPEKNYKVTGVVTKITGMEYGNWFLDDGTYDWSTTEKNTDGLYIYGTLDKQGKSGKNNSIDAWGIEVGDVITVEGPKQIYNGQVEMVNVTVVKLVKALLSLDVAAVDFKAEGGEQTIVATVKGDTFEYESDVDWIYLSDYNQKAQGKVEVSFHVDPNLSYDERVGTVTFKSSSSSQTSEQKVVFTQKALALDGHLYELAEEIEDGATYVLVTPSGKMMTNITGNYGYPAAAEANVFGDYVITLSESYNYTFEAVEGGYKIKQNDDRYLYQQGTYNNFNVSAKVPDNGSPVFTVEFAEDGTITLTNVDKQKSLGYNETKNIFECSTATGLETVYVYKYVRSEGSVLKTYSYKKATSGDLAGKSVMIVGVKDGKYYAAVPVPASNNYGYPAGLDVTDKLEGDVITVKNQENQWILTKTAGGVKLEQPDGRFGYYDGSHASFQIAAKDADDALVTHTLTANADGTWKITCGAGSVRHGDGTYTTFGYYTGDNGTAPYIYVLVEDE